MKLISDATSSDEQQTPKPKCQHLVSVPAYGSGAYWARRYTAQDRSMRVDWLCTFRHVEPILQQLVKSKAKVFIYSNILNLHILATT